MPLKEKVVLITGASSGIGAGTAVHFAGLGSYLALCGRNQENLKAVAKQCREKGLPDDKVLCVVGDLSKIPDCERTIQEVVKHFGKLDVLVNNAGCLVPGGIEEVSIDDFDMQMNVNVRSLFVMTKLAVPYLVNTKGNIVNVSSIAGPRSFPGLIAYGMSKAAVDQLTRCCALDLAAKQVRVNAINPGVIVTEVHKRGGMSDQQYEQFLDRSKSTHALGRVGTVEEVAKSIAFLASDEASFTTGITLPIDGGRGIMCPR